MSYLEHTETKTWCKNCAPLCALAQEVVSGKMLVEL